MTITLNGTSGITTPAETVTGTDVWSVGSTQIYKNTSGNVGIGTSTPDALLHVYQTGGKVATFGNNVNNNGTYIVLAGSSSNKNWAIANNMIAGGALEFVQTSATGGTTIGTTQATSIDSSGNFKATTTGSYLGDSCHQLGVNNANSYGLIVFNSSASPASEYIVDSRFTASTPNNTSARFYNCVDSTATRALIASNGGLWNYQANNANLSDAREKTNVELAGSYLDKICAIPVKTFNYIDQNLEEDGGLTLGVIAQEVQAVAPELVAESDWGTKEEPKMRLSIYQTDLQYALMKCIQEQQEIINDLKARIETLESK